MQDRKTPKNRYQPKPGVANTIEEAEMFAKKSKENLDLLRLTHAAQEKIEAAKKDWNSKLSRLSYLRNHDKVIERARNEREERRIHTQTLELKHALAITNSISTSSHSIFSQPSEPPTTLISNTARKDMPEDLGKFDELMQEEVFKIS